MKRHQEEHPPPGFFSDAVSRVRPALVLFPEAGAGPSAQRALQRSGSVGKAGAAAFIPSSGEAWLEKTTPKWAPNMPPSPGCNCLPQASSSFFFIQRPHGEGGFYINTQFSCQPINWLRFPPNRVCSPELIKEIFYL